jgi:hypothetical protein
MVLVLLMTVGCFQSKEGLKAIGTMFKVASYSPATAATRLGGIAQSYYSRKGRWPRSLGELENWSRGKQNMELVSIGFGFEIIRWESSGPKLAISVRKKPPQSDTSEELEAQVFVEPPTRQH